MKYTGSHRPHLHTTFFLLSLNCTSCRFRSLAAACKDLQVSNIKPTSAQKIGPVLQQHYTKLYFQETGEIFTCIVWISGRSLTGYFDTWTFREIIVYNMVINRGNNFKL